MLKTLLVTNRENWGIVRLNPRMELEIDLTRAAVAEVNTLMEDLTISKLHVNPQALGL